MASLQYVDINGASLAYRICGPPDAPLIITLHGGRGFGTDAWTHGRDGMAMCVEVDGSNKYRQLRFRLQGV